MPTGTHLVKMSEACINICDNNDVNPIFVRANGFLIDKHADTFKNKSAFSRIEILEKLWVTEFHGTLQKDPALESKYQVWDKIIFDTENRKTMFLLRWS